MLMPSIFNDSLFNDFFDYPFNGYKTTDLMKTDIRDTGQGYEVTMNLPGIKKEDVKAELKDGYLTIHASSSANKDEQDSKGRYIRRERYSGSCSRSFYVGDAMTQGDIRARFENGTLRLMIPKKEPQPAVEDRKYIPIEG